MSNQTTEDQKSRRSGRLMLLFFALIAVITITGTIFATMFEWIGTTPDATVNVNTIPSTPSSTPSTPVTPTVTAP